MISKEKDFELNPPEDSASSYNDCSQKLGTTQNNLTPENFADPSLISSCPIPSKIIRPTQGICKHTKCYNFASSTILASTKELYRRKPFKYASRDSWIRLSTMKAKPVLLIRLWRYTKAICCLQSLAEPLNLITPKTVPNESWCCTTVPNITLNHKIKHIAQLIAMPTITHQLMWCCNFLTQYKTIQKHNPQTRHVKKYSIGN